MGNFEKIIRLGTLPKWPGSLENTRRMSIFCKIKFADGKLSITGVEGPRRNGHAIGACGQIVMHLLEPAGLDGYDAAPGWSATMAARFLEVWDRWHLNDMKAGSPAQESWLRENPVKTVYPKSYYEEASKALVAAGLNPDKDGYKYGHEWKFEAVPEDILQWLASLPDSDLVPAWV